MYTQAERPIPVFCESDEIPHTLQAPRYPFWVPVFSLSIVLASRHKTVPKGWDYRTRGGNKVGGARLSFEALDP